MVVLFIFVSWMHTKHLTIFSKLLKGNVHLFLVRILLYLNPLFCVRWGNVLSLRILIHQMELNRMGYCRHFFLICTWMIYVFFRVNMGCESNVIQTIIHSNFFILSSALCRRRNDLLYL